MGLVNIAHMASSAWVQRKGNFFPFEGRGWRRPAGRFCLTDRVQIDVDTCSRRKYSYLTPRPNEVSTLWKANSRGILWWTLLQ